MARLSIRLAALIVFVSTSLLFLSGYFLQQQSLRALEAAIAPRHPPPAPPRKQKLTTQRNRDDTTQRLLALGRKKRLAYATSVSSQRDLCHALMLFADIAQAGSDAARILYYPRVWEDENAHTGRTWKRLMRAAELEYDVLLRPLEGGVDERTVLAAAFAETGFSRVAWLDHGGSLLRSLDDLLLSLPPAIVAKPWRAEGRMWILEPAVSESERLLESEKSVHELYAEHTLVFPQHPWFLETAEFRRSGHAAYLRPAQTWEPVAVRDAVAYLSFRDPEVPMPWTQISGGVLERLRPRDSSDVEVWWMLYRRWERSRADVCGLDLEAPEKAV